MMTAYIDKLVDVNCLHHTGSTGRGWIWERLSVQLITLIDKVTGGLSLFSIMEKFLRMVPAVFFLNSYFYNPQHLY